MKSRTSFHLDETRPLLELFETLTESSPDGIAVKDTHGRVLVVNPAGARILGKRPDEIVGRDDSELYPAGMAARMAESDHRVLETGLPDSETFVMITAGVPRSYQKSSAPYRSPTGKILGIVCIIRDTTERERAEEIRRVDSERIIRFQSALLGLERSHEDSIESMLKLILKTDAEILGVERVSFWVFAPNRSFIQCRLLYRLSDGSCERGLRLDAKDFPRYFQALEDSRVVPADDARSDPRTCEFTETYLKPQGITSMMDVPVRLHGALAGVLCHEHVGPLRRWQLEEQHFATSVADRIEGSMLEDERRKADREIRRLNETLEQRVAARTVQLREAIEELDTFAYSVSHDLRAPLRAMRGFSQVLLEDFSGRSLDYDGQSYVNRISEAALRMDLLIQDLLHYSRLSRSQIRLEPVDLKSIANSVLTSLEREIETRNAQITVEEPLPDLLGDRILLVQILTNLMSNALKFVAPGARPVIRIRGERRDGTVRLWVIDNGIGIAPEHQERIFKIFERLNSAADYPGTGIGLALVRKAADRMGGSVGVESELGRGSRFWVELSAR